MKSNRILVLVLLLAVVMCASLAMPKYAEAAEIRATPLTKLSGYVYYADDLLEEAGFTVLENQTGVMGGRNVSYKLIEDADGAVVGDKTVADGWTTVTGEVEFRSVGTYCVKVQNKSETNEAVYDTFSVKTSLRCDASTLYYSLSPEKLAVYNTKINELLNPSEGDKLKVGDVFNVPSVEGMLCSDYFIYSDLSNKTVYYADSTAASFTSATSMRFTINTPGTYSFYVLATDPVNNKLSVDDLVLGVGGWYNKDANGDRTGDVVVPVFGFTVENYVAPKIAIGTSENGYLDLEYTISCFTVTADSYNSEYSLIYSDTKFELDDYDGDEDRYTAAILASIDNDNDNIKSEYVSEENFNKDTLTFTPDKTGYYYAYIRVVDARNMPKDAISRPIVVDGGYTTVKVEKEIIKNNLVSVICLCVAFLSAVSIVVLLCIKPKEAEVVLETKSNATKKNAKK